MADEANEAQPKSAAQKVVSALLVVVVLAVIVGWKFKRPILRYFDRAETVQEQEATVAP